MVKPPKPVRATKEKLTQFVPIDVGDPVPPFLRDLRPELLKELAVAQVRTQKAILEARVQGAAEMEKLLSR